MFHSRASSVRRDHRGTDSVLYSKKLIVKERARATPRPLSPDVRTCAGNKASTRDSKRDSARDSAREGRGAPRARGTRAGVKDHFEGVAWRLHERLDTTAVSSWVRTITGRWPASARVASAFPTRHSASPRALVRGRRLAAGRAAKGARQGAGPQRPPRSPGRFKGRLHSPRSTRQQRRTITSFRKDKLWNSRERPL